MDHTVKYKDVKEVVCCACGKRQETGEKCVFCGQLFSNCYCVKCKNIYILDHDTEPYFHCDTCGICHIFAQKEFTTKCRKCHQCVPISKLDEHECDEEMCLVCQGIIAKNFDFVTLPCNPHHKMHEVCYQ